MDPKKSVRIVLPEEVNNVIFATIVIFVGLIAEGD
jgi:hypothetical protein